MTINDDVATLRGCLTANGYPDPDDNEHTCPFAALVRVEAEIARLTLALNEWAKTARAAEADNSRLRARLDAAHRYRESQEGLPPGTLGRDLADQDGAACPDCGHSPNTPAHRAECGAPQPKPRSEYGGYMCGEPWGGAA